MLSMVSTIDRLQKETLLKNLIRLAASFSEEIDEEIRKQITKTRDWWCTRRTSSSSSSSSLQQSLFRDVLLQHSKKSRLQPVESCLFLYESNFIVVVIRVCFSRREVAGNPEEEVKAKAVPGMVKETKPVAAAAAAQDPVLCSKVPALVSAFVDSFVDFVVGGQILGSPASSLNQQASRRFTRVDEVDGSQWKQQQQKKKNKSEAEEKGRGMLTTWLPAPERLIAVGDLHGDLSKTRAALRVAQVIDENDKWIGGRTVVVQVGDLLDRGGEELKVIYLLEKLRLEAQRNGGNVHIMNGNHEIMNIEGDFRYATLAGMHEFRTWAHWFSVGNLLKDKCGGLGKQPNLFQSIPASYPEGLRARMAALRPGGPISSRFLASHPTVLVVGSSVFVHGGLLPAHVDHGLDRINLEVRDWMLGRNGWRAPPYLHGANAVVWLRKYSDVKESRCDCDLLDQSIASIPGVQRMVVGHTIQFPMGINSICNDAVIRVDVGLSKGCGDGEPQVLEIKCDRELRVLSAHSPTQFINAASMVQKGMGIRGDDDKAGHPSLSVRNRKRGL